MIPHIFPVLAVLPAFVSLSAAYSWTFANAPAQCEDLTINLAGSGGQGPYTLLIVPVGESPLLDGIEVREPVEIPFNTSTSVTFRMSYPENSQFAAVVSDSTTFGNGGTSAAVTVAAGVSSSCFDATKNATPSWTFNLATSANHFSAPIVECSSLRLWWDTQPNMRGTAQFQGVIPGGQSFEIPAEPITAESGQGTGFLWTPSVPAGTTVIVVGGDGNGQGTGGAPQYTVQAGDESCLSSTSPSSTPGTPAGGTIPTSIGTSTVLSIGTSTAGSGSAGSAHVKIAPIVAGVIGGIVGVVAIGLVLRFCVIRRHKTMAQKKNIDLFSDGSEKGLMVGDAQPLPENYQIEPFIYSDRTVSSVYGTSSGSFHGHPSASGSGDHVASPPASPPNARAKPSAQLSFRPINIIQHDDAGRPQEPQSMAELEPETIELPPAYTNIQREDAPAAAGGSSAGPANIGWVDEKARLR